jgi:hypothetical protein
MNSTRKTIIWVSLFAIAMGFLESSVVIYLRELFYELGFEFPLQPIPVHIARVEFFRELATLIMLIAAGIIAGRTRLERFAYFILAFALWDLFYYLFLYVCIGWPQSLNTWDILFLIPVPWVGPVWAPCLLCLLMIAGALYFIYQVEKGSKCSVSITQWWLMISGAFVCIVSFMWDYLSFTCRQKHCWSIFSSEKLFSDLGAYVPQHFNITLFFTGFLCMGASLILSILKSIKK